jgi:hypothetical protein
MLFEKNEKSADRNTPPCCRRPPLAVLLALLTEARLVVAKAHPPTGGNLFQGWHVSAVGPALPEIWRKP